MIEFLIKGLISVLAMFLFVVVIVIGGYGFLLMDWLWSKLK